MHLFIGDFFFFFNTEKIVLLPKHLVAGEAGRSLAVDFHWSRNGLCTGPEQSGEAGEAGIPVRVGSDLLYTPFWKAMERGLSTSTQLVCFGFQLLWAKVPH